MGCKTLPVYIFNSNEPTQFKSYEQQTISLAIIISWNDKQIELAFFATIITVFHWDIRIRNYETTFSFARILAIQVIFN